jgi:hypothetical protein
MCDQPPAGSAGAEVAEDGRALLARLVCSCVSLAGLAGETIRAVQLGREREQARGGDGGSDGGGGDALGESLKDPGDTRSYLTVADVRAQKVIVDGLRRCAHHYMIQPLVELYGGCMVVLKVS